jgi:hypothetical protein
MKSAFLITATMFSGIVGVFGIPTASSGLPNTTFHTVPGSQLARFASSNNTASTSNTGPGLVQRSICYATNPSTFVIGVGLGIDQEGAGDAALKDCGDGCSVDDCGDQPTCYAFATGAAEISHSTEVVLVVHRVNADSQKAAAEAESVAVKECSTLIHGNCFGLGHRCL